MRALAAVGTASLAICCLLYLAFFNHIEPSQTGIAWNFVNGEVSRMRSGWHVSPPWTWVARIDTRPIRICITSSSRSYNCRLVQFEPDAFREFVAVQGFYYYWWSNRISFNFGYSEEYRGMKDLLRGYAYGMQQYPFVTTLREYKPGE